MSPVFQKIRASVNNAVRSLTSGTLLFYPEPATDGLSHHNVQLVLLEHTKSISNEYNHTKTPNYNDK
jgi:hypothetical protein